MVVGSTGYGRRWRCSRYGANSVTVLVSVPYYRNPDWVGDAVRSILAQTYRDLVCVVVGDGEAPPLSGITDSRLVVYTLPENRGAYFAQSVSLGASPYEWYAPHAADDWSEPDHLERLLAHGTDVATGAVWYHNGAAEPKVVHKLYEVGCYTTARMRSIGGYNPAERIGQDSLTLRCMRIPAEMPATTYPTYHRVQRAGSLSTDLATKKGSPARNAMRARNRVIVAKCERLGTPEAIRKYRESIIPSAIRAEVAEHVEVLRAQL